MLTVNSTLCCPHCTKPIFDAEVEVDGYIIRHNILITPSGRSIKLYASALLMLKILLTRKNKPVKHDSLIALLYGSDADANGSIESIRVNVVKLRRMIQQHKLPFRLETCFRFGYKLTILNRRVQ